METRAIGDLQTAEAKHQEAKTWQTGGENKRKVEALTTAINLALAGQSPQAIATGAASPYINQAIKQLTEDYPSLNIPAHIIWGAIEAELGGGSATTGAIAAGVGELGAKIIHEKLYNNKPTEQLTEEEKQNILALSKLAAAVAGGLTATGNSAESLATISQGMKVAENAVGNNYLLVDYSNLKGLVKTDTEQGQKINEKLEQAGVENIDDYAAQYRACGENESCQK